MTDNFSIMISNSSTGAVLVTATVEIHGDVPRLAEIHAEPTDDGGFVPQALAHIDFPLLVRTANLLSSTSACVSAAATSSILEEGGDQQPVEKVGAVRTLEEANGFSPASNDATGRIDETHEQTQLRNGQKASVPADFGVTYWRLGSIAKVSRHYGVPHYIAQDWIKSLQQQGKLANPWPSKTSRPRHPQ
ncbi:hypothetical protein [Nocardia sp. NBC_01009]|uniref:hypothetical protein n=1 Tax=Nocardia sp. NBC_01009 TaxID=2975996 RepID=UPI003863722C|nr:hypothetical protein OHA42_17460 [Nocardia sp. NBC_01009]